MKTKFAEYVRLHSLIIVNTILFLSGFTQLRWLICLVCAAGLFVVFALWNSRVQIHYRSTYVFCILIYTVILLGNIVVALNPSS